jgi:hypothetical protein
VSDQPSTRELAGSRRYGALTLAFWSALALVVLVVSVLILASGVFVPRQGVQISFSTARAGNTWLFWSEDQQWANANSLALPSREGFNQLFYPVPVNSGTVLRWDPAEEAGEYRIMSVNLSRGDQVARINLSQLRSPPHREERQSLSDGVLTATDADPQVLIDVGSSLAWRLPTAVVLLLCGLALILAAGVFVALRAKRGLTTEQVSIATIAWLYVVFVLYVWKGASRLPYWDDWRYLRDVTPAGRLPVTVDWLFHTNNDTVFATGKLFDATILNATNFSFFSVQVFGVLMLGLLLTLLILLVHRVTRDVSPRTTPYVILLLGFGLMGNSYWLQPAIAYHQMLPLLFGTAIILLLGRAGAPWLRSLLIGILALAAGFAYISGAVMLMIMALVLILARRRTLEGSSLRPALPVLALLAAAITTLTVQIWLVQSAQGSLMEATSASPTTLPWQPSFWAFFLGIAGRAIGLGAAPMPVLIVVAGIFLATPVVVWKALGTRPDSPTSPASYERFVLTFVATLIPLYFGLVAAGRAGLAPVRDFQSLVAYGAARFHFFWGAALLAFVWFAWYRAVTRIPSKYGRSALAVLVAITVLIAVPKTFAPWYYTTQFAPRATAFVRNEGCIVSHVLAQDVGTIMCKYASSGDIAPQLQTAYRFHMTFIRQGHLPP